VGRPTDEPTFDSRLALLHELGNGPALNLPAGLTFEQWKNIGATLVHTEQRIMWWLGDWWLYGEDRWDEAPQAIPMGYSAETLRKAAWTAQRIEPARRHPELSHGHHEAVAALPPADQDRLLDRAATEGMNRHHLRQAAKAAANGNGQPAPARERDYRCPECGHEWDGAPRP
jgi:hypothetical protein